MRLQSSLHGEERALALSDIPRVFWGSLRSLAATQCFSSLKNPSECRMG